MRFYLAVTDCWTGLACNSHLWYLQATYIGVPKSLGRDVACEVQSVYHKRVTRFISMSITFYHFCAKIRAMPCWPCLPACRRLRLRVSDGLVRTFFSLPLLNVDTIPPMHNNAPTKIPPPQILPASMPPPCQIWALLLRDLPVPFIWLRSVSCVLASTEFTVRESCKY